MKCEPLKLETFQFGLEGFFISGISYLWSVNQKLIVMELEKIELTKNQEIQNICMEPADNGGCVIRYSIYTPALRNSESVYDSKTEVFDEDEVETTAMRRIVELYRADMASKRGEKSSPATTKPESIG
jgi:hypothetical protein